MNQRRKFLRFGLPATAAAAASTVRAADGDVKDLLGAWNTVHSLPFPPGAFQELLVFTEGGGVLETNSFFNTGSALDFAPFGFPKKLSASDGKGSWVRKGPNRVDVEFRKLLFDQDRNYVGQFRAQGQIQIANGKLQGEWLVAILDPNDQLAVNLGPATSSGVRIGGN